MANRESMTCYEFLGFFHRACGKFEHRENLKSQKVFYGKPRIKDSLPIFGFFHRVCGKFEHRENLKSQEVFYGKPRITDSLPIFGLFPQSLWKI